MGFKVGQTVSCKNKNLVLQGVVSDAYHEEGIDWIELQGIDNEFEASEFELIKELDQKPEKEACPFCTPTKKGHRGFMLDKVWYSNSNKMKHTQRMRVGRKKNRRKSYVLRIEHDVYHPDGFIYASNVDEVLIKNCPRCGRRLG